uniref:Uncharacterized protein n=1 Tax=Alexandrium catenella TaxID=2925 RepID=A0A7S1RJT0_ALECA
MAAGPPRTGPVRRPLPHVPRASTCPARPRTVVAAVAELQRARAEAAQETQKVQLARTKAGLKELREEMGRLRTVYEADTRNFESVVEEIQGVARWVATVKEERARRRRRASYLDTESTLSGLSTADSRDSSCASSPTSASAAATTMLHGTA